MKALTICQPYAHLICCLDAGDSRGKRVENRKWPSSYRGPLLIHAGKSRDWLDLHPYEGIDNTYNIPLADMTFGAVVGRVDLVDCIRIEEIETSGKWDQKYPWLRDHEHTEGPWCWVLANPMRLPEPVPWKGQLGLFDIPMAGVLAAFG